VRTIGAIEASPNQNRASASTDSQSNRPPCKVVRVSDGAFRR